MQVAKRENITLLIVGHVTKEGAIAGPSSFGTFGRYGVIF
jgi:predicted ATP-dependent serine protease